MLTVHPERKPPFTLAVREALRGINNSAIEADLLFLEAWEMHPSSHLGVTLRASQIRRANPILAAAIDAELKAGSTRTAVQRFATPAEARSSQPRAKITL
jgi:hypothetical protein